METKGCVGNNFVYIKNNDGLHDLEGFKNLQNLQDILYVKNNSALTNFQELRLKSVSRIEVYANRNLQSLNGLDNLTAIKFDGYAILISSNDNLRNLHGLQKVTVVKGAIEIADNPLLADFCGLKALFSAGNTGSFSFQNNSTNPFKYEILSSCP